ncbi:DUF2868 domain-containing protein [Psychromonas sp. L1A2]|uniref:DUF2868 domain-containing protein n=1 Tax=Psychromonas sp. L1A2 TaxID=2686356 RepID=UPI00135C64AF|nr:DUF2868 domain-containing protein [Psychromonas sp. L1A2]
MSLYQDRLLTEGIRIIEKNAPSDSFNADYSALTFQDALFKRTQLAELRYQTAPVVNHLKKLVKLFCSVMCLFFFMIGATSVSTFLVSETGAQINFFWAIVLFIAPNIVSLVIWLFLYFKKNAINNTWVTNLSLLLITLLDKLHHKISNKHPHYIALFEYYFEHRFGHYLGRAQLSLISHLWWSCYLLGATLSLLLVLATHQVDFIWQTTILSEDVFVQLTQILTTVPHLLGINVPSASDVSNATIGLTNPLPLAQDSRVSWSNLLIFSLTIYALLPRLILMLFFQRAVKSQQKQFSLNLSLPYYVQLKSLLHPIVNTSFISDPDRVHNNQSTRGTNQTINRKGYEATLLVPKNAYPLAIELNHSRFQQANIHAAEYAVTRLINVVDSDSQQMALLQIQSGSVSNIVLYADLKRLPDRGWLSLVKKCHYQSNVQIYLVLLSEKPIEKNGPLSSRLQDWLEMAAQANITEQHITYIFDDLATIKTNEVENG